MVKDASSAKVEMLRYQKHLKDPLSSVYELKSQNICAFAEHDRKIYIIDDTLQMKALHYDSKNEKLLLDATYEFSSIHKQSF